ncbi:MAG: heptaprenyl diphosphate synthase component 1, partial [Alicyclobacillaceae bacterium]|nr:heptaprenyl diphosphate synthase component 1 [Alicyclobacillaceae bacterium]
MLTTEWEKEMRGIEKQIAREVDHPDIREWTSPVSSRPLLWLLWSMTASAGLTPPVRTAVVAASCLVYRGLEIHEIDGTVEDDGAPPATAVLAGDFFSSKYYLLLAKHGLISLIGVLAGAARRVSEEKAKRVGWRWEADAEGYQRLCVSVETAVFHALSRWLSLPDPWPDLI